MQFVTDYKLENYIVNTRWEDFPPEVQERAVACAVDLMTALLLGSRGRQFQVGLSLAKSLFQPGYVPVIGTNEQLNFLGAVMAMGHASNSFDIDDGHNMIKGHPGTSFVAGVMAAGLYKNINYKEYLTTLVVCYEVTIRWALAMQKHYNFLHSTGTYGAFGTAAGVSRIFKMSVKDINNALSVADFHAPLTPVMRAVSFPSMNKDGVPFGASLGALSVLETMAGYQGRTHILEMPEYRDLLDSLGSKYEVMQLYFKPYTCCRWAHQPISACIDLMRDNKITPEQIKKVSVHTFASAAALSKIVPHTADEAQYNIAWPVAAAIVNGDVGFPQVCEEALSNQQIIDMMSRLSFVIDPEMEAAFPAKRLAWVELELTDGRKFKSRVYAAYGEASDHIGLGWIVEKFKKRTAPIISAEKQNELLRLLTGPADISLRSLAYAANPVYEPIA